MLLQRRIGDYTDVGFALGHNTLARVIIASEFDQGANDTSPNVRCAAACATLSRDLLDVGLSELVSQATSNR